MGLVINEMVTNSIKHAFTRRDNGRIELQVRNGKTNITIEVEDNGIGITSRAETTSGTGRKLIQIFSNKFEADFDYVNKNNGTIAKFSIPV